MIWSWLFGLVGWGGAALVLAGVLVLGWALDKKALAIIGAVVAIALLGWGSVGYADARAQRKALAAETVAKDKAIGERDTEQKAKVTAQQERDKARGELNKVNLAVLALKDAATKAEAEAATARAAAAKKAQTLKGKAASAQAKPATVPGDDLASSKDRIWDWLQERGAR